MTQILGSQKEKFRFTCRGQLPKRFGRTLASRLIFLAGMTPARRGRIDHYPYEPNFWKRFWNALIRRISGRGGKGWTGFFPLMESYLIIDVYDDINEVEMLFSTCHPERFNMPKMVNYLNCKIGPTTGERLI